MLISTAENGDCVVGTSSTAVESLAVTVLRVEECLSTDTSLSGVEVEIAAPPSLSTMHSNTFWKWRECSMNPGLVSVVVVSSTCASGLAGLSSESCVILIFIVSSAKPRWDGGGQKEN